MASSDAQRLLRYETLHLVETSGSIASEPQVEPEVFVPAQPIKIRTAQARVTARIKGGPNPITSDLEA